MCVDIEEVMGASSGSGMQREASIRDGKGWPMRYEENQAR